MVIWDKSPSQVTVQLMSTSNGSVSRRSTRGLATGKTNMGVGNVNVDVAEDVDTSIGVTSVQTKM